MKTLSKIAKLFDVIAILYFVYMCGMMLFSSAFLLFANNNSTNSVTFENASFTLAPHIGFDLGSMKVTTLIVAVGTVLFGALSLVLIRRILKPIKNGNLFDISICKSLRQLGVLKLVSGAVMTAVSYFSQRALYSNIGFGNIFLSDSIVGCNVKYNLEFDFIITAVMIFVLSYVFLYGAKLQSRVNEIQNNEEISLS